MLIQALHPLLPLSVQETRRIYVKYVCRTSNRRWNNECSACLLTYSDYTYCGKCQSCWICCSCYDRATAIENKLGIYRIKEDASPTLMDYGYIGFTYVYAQGVLQSMDISFQLRNTKGVTITFTERDIATTELSLAALDKQIDTMIEGGYSVVVYGGGMRGKAPGEKDYVETEQGKQVPCCVADCEGKVYLKQAEDKTGKKYRTLECDKYDYTTDPKNAKGHSKAYISDWEDQLDFKLRVKGVDARKRPNTVEVMLPAKWGAPQRTAYTEQLDEDIQEAKGGNDLIPF